MNRAPTSVFVPPIRRESQQGSGIKRKHKRKNKKKTCGKTKASKKFVTNLKKIIQQIKSVKIR